MKIYCWTNRGVHYKLCHRYNCIIRLTRPINIFTPHTYSWCSGSLLGLRTVTVVITYHHFNSCHRCHCDSSPHVVGTHKASSLSDSDGNYGDGRWLLLSLYVIQEGFLVCVCGVKKYLQFRLLILRRKKTWNEASQNKALDRLYWFAWPWYKTEPSPNSRHLITERHSSREQWSSHPRKVLD